MKIIPLPSDEKIIQYCENCNGRNLVSYFFFEKT